MASVTTPPRVKGAGVFPTPPAAPKRPEPSAFVQRVLSVVKAGPDRNFTLHMAKGFAEYIEAKCGSTYVCDDRIRELYPEAKALAQRQYLMSLPIMQGLDF